MPKHGKGSCFIKVPIPRTGPEYYIGEGNQQAYVWNKPKQNIGSEQTEQKTDLTNIFYVC